MKGKIMTGAGVHTIYLDHIDHSYIANTTAAISVDLSPGSEAKIATDVDSHLTLHALEQTSALSIIGQLTTAQVDVVHVRDLTLETLPPTPLEYQPVESAGVYPFDVPHFVIASIVGKVYGSRHVRGGRLLADIFPRPNYVDKEDSAFGSSQLFDFHADGVVQPDTAPDYFSLHCLRNTEQVPTFFSTVAKEDFDDETFRLLTEPMYTLLYERGNNRDILPHTPIIVGDEEILKLNYYGAAKVFCEHDDPAYSDALTAFANALERNASEVILEPSDVLIVNNNRVLHGRRPFNPLAIQTDERRWLRRLFIAQRPGLIEKIASSAGRIVWSEFKQT